MTQPMKILTGGLVILAVIHAVLLVRGLSRHDLARPDGAGIDSFDARDNSAPTAPVELHRSGRMMGAAQDSINVQIIDKNSKWREAQPSWEWEPRGWRDPQLIYPLPGESLFPQQFRDPPTKLLPSRGGMDEVPGRGSDDRY